MLSSWVRHNCHPIQWKRWSKGNRGGWSGKVCSGTTTCNRTKSMLIATKRWSELEQQVRWLLRSNLSHRRKYLTRGEGINMLMFQKLSRVQVPRKIMKTMNPKIWNSTLVRQRSTLLMDLMIRKATCLLQRIKWATKETCLTILKRPHRTTFII